MIPFASLRQKIGSSCCLPLLLGMLFWSSGPMLWGQTDSPDSPPPATVSEAETPPGTTAPSDGTESTTEAAAPTDVAVGEELPVKVETTATGERIIYVPFRDLNHSFQSPDANVVLPISEYQAMLKAWRAQLAPQSAPGAVITSADYVVQIDGDLARIAVTYKVNVTGKPWSVLPLKFGQAAVGKLTGDGVLMRGTGEGTYELLFESPGETEVQLELALPVSQSPDGRQFQYPVPPVAVTTIDITVPRKNQTIEVNPKLVSLPLPDEADAEADVTRVRANLGATSSIAIRWFPQASLKPEMHLLASVTNQTLITLEDGLLHTDTWLNYEILRGSMESCRVAVPIGQRILDVNASARIKSWKAEEQGEMQVVEIEFLTAVDKPVTVEVHTEARLDGNQFHAAGLAADGVARGIHALDVIRESGEIAIRHGADVALTVAEQQGVVRTEADKVAPRLKGNNALSYKFYSPTLSLLLTVRPVEPRLLVTHQAVLTFQDAELQAMDVLDYVIERAGVFELQLRVPEGMVIDRVQGGPLREHSFDAESRLLTVSLRERTTGAFQLNIQSHRPLMGNQSEFPLPVLEPLSVERETGTIFVYARDSIEVITDPAGLVGVQPFPAPQQRRSGAALNSAWSFTARPVTIPVRTQRKPTRLHAFVGTSVDVQPELTQVQTFLDYRVEFSGVNTFRFEVPAAISERLQIEVVSQGEDSSAPIKQRTAAEPAEDWVVWTVETQREVLGAQRFLITYDLPADGDENENETEQVLHLIRPLGLVDAEGAVQTALSSSPGEVVVKKERSLSISARGQGGGMEMIDLRELQRLPQEGTVAFRYFQSSADDRPQLRVVQSRFEIQEVVSTIVSRGLVEIVSGEDHAATYRCRYSLKTSERQRLLVHLPVNLEVLGTFLNEKEVRLEKAEDATPIGESWTPFWVNVARPEASDVPVLLTFQFLWKVNPPLGESPFGRGEMSFPLPVIGEAAESVVQELKVVVWVPEKYALVGDPDRFELRKSRRPAAILLGKLASRAVEQLDGWVSGGVRPPASISQLPTEGRVPYTYTNLGGARQIEVHWWNMLTMTIIVSVALAIIGWLLMRTSWENKLGMLLMAAFVAALFGLSDSHALSQGLYAARIGLCLLVGLWLIQGVGDCLACCKGTVLNTGSAVVVATSASAEATAGGTGSTGTTTTTQSPQSEVNPPSPPEGS